MFGAGSDGRVVDYLLTPAGGVFFLTRFAIYGLQGVTECMFILLPLRHLLSINSYTLLNNTTFMKKCHIVLYQSQFLE